MVNFHIPGSLESRMINIVSVLPPTLTRLYIVLTRTVQPLQTGPWPHPRPGAGQQLGGLPVSQGLDGVLRTALRVARVAAQHQVPGHYLFK